MYMLCAAMEWSHLPVPGGIYDQHPKFVDDMFFLFQQKAKSEAQRQAERERKQKAASRKR